MLCAECFQIICIVVAGTQNERTEHDGVLPLVKASERLFYTFHVNLHIPVCGNRTSHHQTGTGWSLPPPMQ